MDIKENFYDVIIVGGGPAGLSAAIYMARAKYRTLVLEKDTVGGQITITSEVVNYPGIVKTDGKKLTGGMHTQAESFGAEFLMGEVLDMELEEEVKTLHTTKGEFKALGVILAVGANPRKLGFKGERKFQGRGVAYCATCDGEFFTGMDVFVIGGGFAAVEEGLFLTKYARSVTLVVREETYTCARTVSDKLEGQAKVKSVFETELIEVGGEETLSYARFRNNATGETWTHEAGDVGFGIFVFAGYVPNTKWLPASIEKDEQGYLVTDMNHKTNLEGVYAAGDVCVKNLRQVVTAVSDGAVAATSLEKYVEELHQRLGIADLRERQGMPERAPREDSPEETGGKDSEEFIDVSVRSRLKEVFEKFESAVLLRAWLDDSALADEMLGFLRELDAVTDKVSWEQASHKQIPPGLVLPSIEVCRADGNSTGIHFHGIPGGHEFNSFIVALYNVAGPGREIEKAVEERIRAVREEKNLKIMVSLSCRVCPETVMSAQKAAAVSPCVQAEMFDLTHFPSFREKYKIMSVPCVIVNDETVYFGKKSVGEIAEILHNK